MAKISRKPKTFVGMTMPEINRPQPKMKPQARLASARMAQPPMTCRVTATTAMAAIMKTPVATIERGDSRAMPDAVPGRAAVAQPGAEADQDAGDGYGDE